MYPRCWSSTYWPEYPALQVHVYPRCWSTHLPLAHLWVRQSSMEVEQEDPVQPETKHIIFLLWGRSPDLGFRKWVNGWFQHTTHKVTLLMWDQFKEQTIIRRTFDAATQHTKLYTCLTKCSKIFNRAKSTKIFTFESITFLLRAWITIFTVVCENFHSYSTNLALCYEHAQTCL